MGVFCMFSVLCGVCTVFVCLTWTKCKKACLVLIYSTNLVWTRR